MTSYFDDRVREVSALPFRHTDSLDAYLEAVAAIEAPVIADVLLNTGDREFPADLRERILDLVALHAIRGPGGLPPCQGAIDYALATHSSSLLAELHSAFHALAARRAPCRWGHWSDSPRQNLLSRHTHDEEQ